MTPIHSHVAHPSALFIDSGPHSHSLSFCPFFTSILPRAAPILPAFPGTVLLSNTSPSYPHILTLCLIASVLSHFSLPLSSLPPFICMLPLIISLKSLPNVTPVSTHHSRSAPDSCWVAPTPSHSTLVESHSVSDLPLFTHIGPHFPHFTHLGPSDLHPLSLCCIIASSSPSSALYFHPLITLPIFTSIHIHASAHSPGLILTGIPAHYWNATLHYPNLIPVSPI